MPKARYYIALGAEQDGDKPKAIALYQKILADGPDGAPWMGVVRQRLASLGVSAPASSSSEAAAIAALDADAQQSAIRGMVERLAAKLAPKRR